MESVGKRTMEGQEALYNMNPFYLKAEKKLLLSNEKDSVNTL